MADAARPAESDRGRIGSYRIELSARNGTVHVALVGASTVAARRHVAEVCEVVAACGLRVELVGS